MAITINGDGTLTGISTGGLPDGIVDTDMLATDAVTAAKIGSLPAGSVLQVVSTTKTDVFSSSSNTFVDVTGLSVDITPSSTNSKILIIAALTQSNNGSTVVANLVRGSTTIAQPAGSPSTPGTVNLTVNSTDLASSSIINFLDSPSTTSSTTYKIQVRRQASGVTFYINRRNDDANHAYVSTITAIEVAG